MFIQNFEDISAHQLVLEKRKAEGLAIAYETRTQFTTFSSSLFNTSYSPSNWILLFQFLPSYVSPEMDLWKAKKTEKKVHLLANLSLMLMFISIVACQLATCRLLDDFSPLSFRVNRSYVCFSYNSTICWINKSEVKCEKRKESSSLLLHTLKRQKETSVMWKFVTKEREKSTQLPKASQRLLLIKSKWIEQ